MAQPVVGVLHPERMGVELGRCLKEAGARVVWASEGKSAQMMELATAAGLEDVKEVQSVAAVAEIIISVTESENEKALDIASDVWSLGFKGLYVDANAVAPSTAERIADLFPNNYVDGGIIGPPPTKAGTTRFYLSGPSAGRVAALFPSDSRVQAIQMEGAVTAASALKVTYTAWARGSTALLLNVRALAEGAGVGSALEAEWDLSYPGVTSWFRQAAVETTGVEAWRLDDEMGEVTTMFTEAGLPCHFHRGAKEVYRRLSQLRDREGPPDQAETMELILKPAKRGSVGSVG